MKTFADGLLREQPLHIISLGSSGTGKTYLQEKISQLIPEEQKLEITTLSVKMHFITLIKLN